MMELQAFIASLQRLDRRGISAVAAELQQQAASVAGEVSWWQATIEIDRQLRARSARRLGASAAHQASMAVLQAAAEAGIALPDDEVIAVARAAGEVARGLVAQSSAANDLLRGCRHLVAA